MESCSEINQNDPTDGGGTELVGVLSHSLVECPICLQLLCEPLTTPCGHSFCRPCLVNTLRKSRKKCPTCRAVCHMEPETQCESIVLASIVKSCFPDQYSVRLADVEREKSSWSTILPIFFYNDTLFPYSCLALHLFEERYKVMIRRIVEASRKFCYLPNFANYEASVGDVGVVAEITDVEFMANGRANLQVADAFAYLPFRSFIADAIRRNARIGSRLSSSGKKTEHKACGGARSSWWWMSPLPTQARCKPALARARTPTKASSTITGRH
mmetsp:Transcript_31640/g.84609  ORF Transcript_31640/g.84609 Transcript_31640/m.84609 type:complete len:271 (-) Transcript_31640:457-1269(-)